mgnify:CR=1 FL=1
MCLLQRRLYFSLIKIVFKPQPQNKVTPLLRHRLNIKPKHPNRLPIPRYPDMQFMIFIHLRILNLLQRYSPLKNRRTISNNRKPSSHSRRRQGYLIFNRCLKNQETIWKMPFTLLLQIGKLVFGPLYNRLDYLSLVNYSFLQILVIKISYRNSRLLFIIHLRYRYNALLITIIFHLIKHCFKQN